jgi:hypothetical protein
MTELEFLSSVQFKARTLKINPLLLLSGIEGLYTFRNVPLNKINYEYLDSLILTIFALRVGDQFHTLAEQNLTNTHITTSVLAERELTELTPEEIEKSQNPYLQSFASLLQGKTVVRRYHVKALEVAALELKKAQVNFQTNSISTILLAHCKEELQQGLHVENLFSS